MELAKNHIAALNPKEMKTATLIHLVGSKYIPDFYGIEREWAWIVFPWNYTEDMVNIIRKVTNKERKSIEQLKKELKTNFNIDVDIAELKELLEHIAYLESHGK